MTEFEVAQRVYWTVTKPHYSGELIAIRGGVIVTTDPAISTIWADTGLTPEEAHMVTMANDRLTADLEDIAADVKAKNAPTLARWAEGWNTRREAWDRESATYPVIGTEDPRPFLSRLFGRRK